jgi:hypothetical protein
MARFSASDLQQISNALLAFVIVRDRCRASFEIAAALSWRNSLSHDAFSVANRNPCAVALENIYEQVQPVQREVNHY